MNRELDIIDAELVRDELESTAVLMEHDLVVYRMAEAEAARGGRFDWAWWWDSLPRHIRAGDVDTFRHLIGMGLKNGLA